MLVEISDDQLNRSELYYFAIIVNNYYFIVILDLKLFLLQVVKRHSLDLYVTTIKTQHIK